MKLQVRLSLLLLLFMVASFRGIAQDVPRYGDIKDFLPDHISRSEYNSARKTTEAELEKGYNITLGPIDRIVDDVQPVIVSYDGLEPTEVTSWGQSVMMPPELRARVVNECGKYQVVVKIVDSGVDPDHTEYLGPWWLSPANYSGSTGKHWHGTHVAGIAWQLTEGVTRKHGNIRYKDCQFLNASGSGSSSNAVSLFATERMQDEELLNGGTGVVYNNSWGAGVSNITSIDAELQKSTELGVVFTAANGNTGRESAQYPAGSDWTISVAALNEQLNRASFSTIGDFTEVATPGQGINSTMPGNQEGKASGTSMADPFATGLIALAMGKYGDVLHNLDNCRTYLAYIATYINSTDASGQWNKYTGWGIPYVVMMLDTDPCDVPGIDCETTPPDPDPNPDPNPTPDPDPTLGYVAGDFPGGFMRWKYEDETDWRLLHVPTLRAEFIGTADGEALWDKFWTWLPTYFKNRGIVLPKDMDGYDAAWWTGQFLEYIAEQEGMAVDVLHLTAIDEAQRNYFATGFDRAGANIYASRTPGELLAPGGVKFIVIE